MEQARKIRTDRVWTWTKLARVWDCTAATLETKWQDADEDAAIRQIIRWCDVREKPYAYVHDIAEHFGLPEDWVPDVSKRAQE